MKKFLQKAKENRVKRKWQRWCKYYYSRGTVQGYNKGYENGYKMACMQMQDKKDAKRIMDIQGFKG